MASTCTEQAQEPDTAHQLGDLVSRRQPTGGGQRAVLEAGVLENTFANLDARVNPKIRLLYLSCGTADNHLELTRQIFLAPATR